MNTENGSVITVCMDKIIAAAGFTALSLLIHGLLPKMRPMRMVVKDGCHYSNLGKKYFGIILNI